jgi:LDH2 family malate/lactate/ureidoglycolate dehydrogenase
LSSSAPAAPSTAVAPKPSAVELTGDTVRLSEAEAHALGLRALRGVGFTEEEARLTVDQMVDNALCGYTFAGLSRILAIAEDPKSNQARQPITIVRETDGSALIDGGNHVGYVSVSKATDIAIEKAKRNRFAVVGVFNSYYSGRNAYFLERVARADLVGMHTASAKPRVAPLGGKRAALGTNPIAFGFPSTRGPVVFDMGTASVMWGDVLMHARINEPLPEGIGLDSEGNATRDAREVAGGGGVLPFGGHKGYGLSFSVQALGLLAGSALARGTPQDYGFLLVVFDPGLTIPLDEFKQQVTDLVDVVKATPKAAGVKEIVVPSERAYREREVRRREGIVIDRSLHEGLLALAAKA